MKRRLIYDCAQALLRHDGSHLMKCLLYTLVTIAGFHLTLLHADSYSEALTHLKTAKLDEALKTINQQIEESPSAAAHELKGRILTQMKQFEPAFEAFQYASRLEPERGSIQYYTGELFFAQERWAEAYAAYRHALELNPEYKASVLKIIYCLVIMENYPLAHEWLTTLNPTDDLNPDYYFARAAMSRATGTPDEYINVLRQARTIYSTQVFNRYEPDLLRVVKQIKARTSGPGNSL